MKVTKRNCDNVAKWLLECDHEDFNGPIDLIAEHCVVLEEAYTQQKKAMEKPSDYADAGTLHITLLARTLYQHLNSPAKAALHEKIAASE